MFSGARTERLDGIDGRFPNSEADESRNHGSQRDARKSHSIGAPFDIRGGCGRGSRERSQSRHPLLPCSDRSGQQRVSFSRLKGFTQGSFLRNLKCNVPEFNQAFGRRSRVFASTCSSRTRGAALRFPGLCAKLVVDFNRKQSHAHVAYCTRRPRQTHLQPQGASHAEHLSTAMLAGRPVVRRSAADRRMFISELHLPQSASNLSQSKDRQWVRMQRWETVDFCSQELVIKAK
jgi:hypothetical protein